MVGSEWSISSGKEKHHALETSATENHVLKLISTNADCVTNLSFSTKFNKLAISTNRVYTKIITILNFIFLISGTLCGSNGYNP